MVKLLVLVSIILMHLDSEFLLFALPAVAVVDYSIHLTIPHQSQVDQQEVVNGIIRSTI